MRGAVLILIQACCSWQDQWHSRMLHCTVQSSRILHTKCHLGREGCGWPRTEDILRLSQSPARWHNWGDDAVEGCKLGWVMEIDALSANVAARRMKWATGHDIHFVSPWSFWLFRTSITSTSMTLQLCSISPSLSLHLSVSLYLSVCLFPVSLSLTSPDWTLPLRTLPPPRPTLICPSLTLCLEQAESRCCTDLLPQSDGDSL